jgi:hypothetical protein
MCRYHPTYTLAGFEPAISRSKGEDDDHYAVLEHVSLPALHPPLKMSEQLI